MAKAVAAVEVITSAINDIGCEGFGCYHVCGGYVCEDWRHLGFHSCCWDCGIWSKMASLDVAKRMQVPCGREMNHQRMLSGDICVKTH